MDFGAATEMFAILGFAGLLIAAAASDWRKLLIPNRYTLAILALFPAYVIASGGDVAWQAHLICGAIAFGAGFLLFTLGFFGGGDVKLFAAVTLWAGPALFMPMLVYTVVAGALLGCALWVQYRFRRESVPAPLNYALSNNVAFSKLPMPYAVAIAAGGLHVALQLFAGI